MSKPEQTFFQTRYTDGQQVYEKFLNIIKHQRNANKNHIEILPYGCENDCSEKDKKIKTKNKWWRGCGGKWTLIHCWWECNLMQPLWETEWRFLKILKIEISYDPAILLLGIYLKKMKMPIWKDTWDAMFITSLFIIAKIGKNGKKL